MTALASGLMLALLIFSLWNSSLLNPSWTLAVTKHSQSSSLFECRRSSFASKWKLNITTINSQTSCLTTLLISRTTRSANEVPKFGTIRSLALLRPGLPLYSAHSQLQRLDHFHLHRCIHGIEQAQFFSLPQAQYSLLLNIARGTNI